MKTRRLLVVLTFANLALLVAVLGQACGARSDGILRGRRLEIVDDAGRVRASIAVVPADPDVQMPDGTKGSPETVLLRLITSQGRPNVKIAATERGAGQVLGGEADPQFVQILAEGPKTMIRMSNKSGQESVLQLP